MYAAVRSWCIAILLVILGFCYWGQLNVAKNNILYTDYGKFYQSTRFILQGKDPYTPIFFKKNQLAHQDSERGHVNPHKSKPIQLPGNLNPPIFNLLILPVGFFAYAVSLTVWAVFSIMCGIFGVLLLQKELNVDWKQPQTTLGLMLAFFIYYPTYASVEFGQITLLLMPLVIGAWVASRRQNLVLAGILLGLAASIKLFFGLFFIYFLVRREWRGLFWFTLVVVLSVILPLILLGKQVFLNYFEIIRIIRWSSSSWNPSIYGFLLRLFGGPELNVPVIAAPYLTKILHPLLSGMLVLGVVKFLWPTPAINYQDKTDLDFSVILIAMLLLSPLGWLYYFSYLIIPFAILLRFGMRGYHPVQLSLWTIFALMLSAISTPLIASGYIAGKYVLMAFASSSLYFSALLILLFLLFWMRKVLLQQQQNFTVAPLSKPVLITLISVVLIPSLVGMLMVTNSLGIYGAGYAAEFSVAYYGS